MSGTLRDDLFQWMCEWQHKADLTIAMGTSLCGMSADKCVEYPANNYIKKNKGYGSVIVGLQRTALDGKASIRIFAKIDQVVALLAEELGMEIPALKPYKPKIPKSAQVREHCFRVPYDKKGNRTKKKSEMIIWNLTRGAAIKVTDGPGKGFEGTMGGTYPPCHYRVYTPKQRQGHKMFGKGNVCYKMGAWWVETAVRGGWPKLPVVNTGIYLQLQSALEKVDR
eukprot:UN06938